MKKLLARIREFVYTLTALGSAILFAAALTLGYCSGLAAQREPPATAEIRPILGCVQNNSIDTSRCEQWRRYALLLESRNKKTTAVLKAVFAEVEWLQGKELKKPTVQELAEHDRVFWQTLEEVRTVLQENK